MKSSVVCLGLFIFLVLAVAPAVSAAETTINVKTLQSHDVTIVVLKPQESYYLLKSFNNIYSAIKGEVSVVYDGSESNVNIRVIVKKNTVVKFNELFEDVSLGDVVTFTVLEGITEVSYGDEASGDNSDEGNNETSEGNTGETGDASEDGGDVSTDTTGTDESDLSGVPGNVLYYIIGFVVLVGVIVFVMFMKHRNAPPHLFKRSPKVTSGAVKSESKDSDAAKSESKEESYDEMKDHVAEVEKRLEDAQKEIKTLKNQEKIKEVERKLEADRKELDRLKKGGE